MDTTQTCTRTGVHDVPAGCGPRRLDRDLSRRRTPMTSQWSTQVLPARPSVDPNLRWAAARPNLLPLKKIQPLAFTLPAREYSSAQSDLPCEADGTKMTSCIPPEYG